MEPDPLDVEVIKMILNELDCGGEVRLVKLVRNIPANWTELAPLLTTPWTHRKLPFTILKYTIIRC